MEAITVSARLVQDRSIVVKLADLCVYSKMVNSQQNEIEFGFTVNMRGKNLVIAWVVCSLHLNDIAVLQFICRLLLTAV